MLPCTMCRRQVEHVLRDSDSTLLQQHVRRGAIAVVIHHRADPTARYRFTPGTPFTAISLRYSRKSLDMRSDVRVDPEHLFSELRAKAALSPDDRCHAPTQEQPSNCKHRSTETNARFFDRMYRSASFERKSIRPPFSRRAKQEPEASTLGETRP